MLIASRYRRNLRCAMLQKPVSRHDTAEVTQLREEARDVALVTGCKMETILSQDCHAPDLKSVDRSHIDYGVVAS